MQDNFLILKNVFVKIQKIQEKKNKVRLSTPFE